MSESSIHHVAAAVPVPIGIPPIFLLDGMRRAPAEDAGAARCSLLSEYIDAVGYVFHWGHVIEDAHAFIAWRFVPVALWHELADIRAGSCAEIPELLASVALIVREALVSHLPRSVQLTGLHRAGRRAPHALFTLLAGDRGSEWRVRRWIDRRLLPELLPPLLEEVAAAVRDSSGAQDDAHEQAVELHHPRVVRAPSPPPLRRGLGGCAARSAGIGSSMTAP